MKIQTRDLSITLRTAAAVAVISFLPSIASAAISYTAISTEANSGISSGNTYTHALNLSGGGAPATPLTIEGVAFDHYNAGDIGDASSLFNFTMSAVSTSNPPIATSIQDADVGTAVTGVETGNPNLSALFSGMVYTNSLGTSTLTYTLSGLQAGQSYDLRIYVRQWAEDTRDVNITFDPDGLAESTGVINEDDSTDLGFAASNQPYYISYTYTANESGELDVVFNHALNNSSWHHYAVTNQIAIPEPSSSALVLTGLATCFLRRRR